MAGVPVHARTLPRVCSSRRAPRRRLRPGRGARPEEEDHPPRGQPRRHARHRHRGRAARPAAPEPPGRGRAGEGNSLRPGVGRSLDGAFRGGGRPARTPGRRTGPAERRRVLFAESAAALVAAGGRRLPAASRTARAGLDLRPGHCDGGAQDALPGRHARRLRLRRRPAVPDRRRGARHLPAGDAEGEPRAHPPAQAVPRRYDS